MSVVFAEHGGNYFFVAYVCAIVFLQSQIRCKDTAFLRDMQILEIETWFLLWIVKSTCQKTKYLQKNQANTCIFEKFIVPLQHDFDYEECLSQHHIGGGYFIILKINELGVF